MRCGGLTSLCIERNSKIVVFDRIFRHVQTDKVGRRILVFLRKCEFGIYKANTELARPAERLHEIGALQNKVHTAAVLEIGEEDKQLNDSLLSNNLDSSQGCFPFLVDWNHHPPAGNGERCSHANQVSKYQTSEASDIPIVKDLEASNGLLKCVEIYKISIASNN
jgi:hypothetical protein